MFEAMVIAWLRAGSIKDVAYLVACIPGILPFSGVIPATFKLRRAAVM
jgi:hypothetical protein